MKLHVILLFTGPGFYGSQVHPGMMPSHPLEDESTDESGGARDFMLKKDDHPGYIRSNPLKEDRQDLEIDQVTPDDLDKLYSHDVQPQQRNPQFPQVNKYTYIVDSFTFFMIVIYFFIRWKKVFLYKVEKDFNFWKMLVFKVS